MREFDTKSKIARGVAQFSLNYRDITDAEELVRCWSSLTPQAQKWLALDNNWVYAIQTAQRCIAADEGKIAIELELDAMQE